MNINDMSKPLFKCTCLVLISSMTVMAVAEIIECPLHKYKDGFTPHTEATLISLGSVNNSGTITTS